MRMLRFLLQKEFRQIFRDPSILRLIFVMPVIQLVVLPFAADYEIKNIHLAIVDHDRSDYTRQLTQKITASRYFQLQYWGDSYTKALGLVEHDKADLILELPAGFERNLVKEQEATLFMALNAINGVKANLGGAYLRSILQEYNRTIREEWIRFPRMNPEPQIEVVPMHWYNPLMNYKFFMVPGILVLLLTMIGANLTAINIVREKEIGTIEQINVTPLRKVHFILGKLIPFWIIGMFIMTLGLVIARVVYGIVPVGSFGTIYLFAAIYLLTVLGLGLLISTYAATQQQSMLVSFFLMMVFILLGGLYTAIDSMPVWAQWVTRFNPVSYFIDVMRRVVLKGAGVKDILPQLGVMAIFALIFNGWAILSYRKRS